MDALDLMLARRSVRRITAQDVSLDNEQKLIDAAFAGATEVVGYERTCCEVLGIPLGTWRVPALVGIGHPGEKKQPRTQRQVSKVSYERFGKRSR